MAGASLLQVAGDDKPGQKKLDLTAKAQIIININQSVTRRSKIFDSALKTFVKRITTEPMPNSQRSRRSHSALPSAVGELELKVLECVWETPGTDAREITSRLALEAPCRLSTVQASLERLVRKELLQREKDGHAYRYYAARSRSELLGSMLKDVIQLLHDGKANTILSSFVNAAAGLDGKALDELEALIQRKRRSVRNKGQENG